MYDEFDNVKSVKMNEVCGSVPCDNKISLKLSNLKVSYKSGITTNKFDIMGYTLDNMQIFKGSYDL